MKILKPNALKESDIIGVVAPAHPFPSTNQPEYIQSYLKGKAELEKIGFKVKESRNLKAVEWWRAGSPEQRAEDINEMYKDPEVNAVIAHDGGNDCISLLEFLDYDLMASNPKPFIGFSNITNIHSALYSKTGLAGFHMGLLTYELGTYWQSSEENIKGRGSELFKNILTSKSPLGEIEPLSRWDNWRDGKASGKLFGGNLSMLDSLIGTPYFPKVDELNGSIIFWELDGLPSYRIERALMHLKYYGLFEVISGMIIGKLVDMKNTAHAEQIEPTTKELVLSVLQNYSFPILAEVDFGHKMIQIPMVLGLEVRMSATEKRLQYLEAAVI